MASLPLKALLQPKAGTPPVLTALVTAMGAVIGIEDATGKLLWGTANPGPCRLSVDVDDDTLGFVTGAEEAATAVAKLLTHLAAKETERRALAAEVLHLYRELHLIEQLSEQLAALLDFDAVGQSALDQARRLITASHGIVLLMKNAEAEPRLIAEFGAGGADISAHSSFVHSIVERGLAEIINHPGSALIGAPLRAKQRTVGVIALANAEGKPYTTADLKLLNTIALQTAAAIENALLCGEMVDAVRDREQLAAIQKELDTARTIQHSLVPRTFPPFPERTDFDIHAQMTSAKAVGGDFFDFFLIDQDRLGVVIGDVSGKGIPAALYMAVTRTQIKTTALQGMPPQECLLAVNRVLVREKVSSMFATCFYGILNNRTGEFHYANAGHNPPYLLRASGEVEAVPSNGNLPIGMFAKMKCTEGAVQLTPGDALFLYTDGVTEATNADMADFTDERLAGSLKASTAHSCRGIIDRVSQELFTFTAGAPQSDDITMLSIRIH